MYIYLLEHPAFEGWIKVGRTSNCKSRLFTYNTGCPNKSFRMFFKIHLRNDLDKVFIVEEYFKYHYETSGTEWFKVSKEEAIDVVKTLCKEEVDNGQINEVSEIKTKKLTIHLDEDLILLLEEDAKKNSRIMKKHLEFIIRNYMAAHLRAEQNQLNLFNQSIS